MCDGFDSLIDLVLNGIENSGRMFVLIINDLKRRVGPGRALKLCNVHYSTNSIFHPDLLEGGWPKQRLRELWENYVVSTRTKFYSCQGSYISQATHPQAP